MAEDIGRHGSAIGCGKQGKNALPIGIEIEKKFAASMSCHAREDCARAKDESGVINLNRIGDGTPRKALVKSLLEGFSCAHPSLRNEPEEMGMKVIEAPRYG